MKTNEEPKMRSDEWSFLTAMVVLQLIILPSLPLGKYGGGIAMLAVSVIGLPVYFVLFGARLRSRGQLSIVSVAGVLAAVLGGAIAFWLTRGPWH